MRSIIVDDEPIARTGIAKLAGAIPDLQVIGSFENAALAAEFMKEQTVDLIFLDIQMPGLNGLDFAKQIHKNTLVIFTTAYSEFALDSYEVDAVDYLVKPIHPERFAKAVEKASSYHGMLMSSEEHSGIEQVGRESMFIRSNRRYVKVVFNDILFVEGLKDYVVIQMVDQRLITHTNLKNTHKLLPQNQFVRVNRSYIVNVDQITSFSNNDVYIDQYEISIGNFYRDDFFERMMGSTDDS